MQKPRRKNCHAQRNYPFTTESLERRVLFAAVVVTSLDDSGVGTLRQAISDANPGDTIDLTGLTGTITLASTLTISTDLTITGPGADKLAISGDNAQQVFEQSSGTVNVSGLTIEDGMAVESMGMGGNGDGGGWNVAGGSSANFTNVDFTGNTAVMGGAIFANSAGGIGGGAPLPGSGPTTLTLTNCTIENNTASDANSTMGEGGIGGGIYISASGGINGGGDGSSLTFTMTSCAVISNTASVGNSGMGSAMGGGIYASASGGIDSGGAGVMTLSITNSTIADNSASSSSGMMGESEGGGMFLECSDGISAPGGSMSYTVANTTIAGNSVSGTNAAGAGVSVFNNSTLSGTIENTLIAGNTGEADLNINASSGVTTGGNNLIQNINTNSNANPFTNGLDGDLIGVNAELGTLADHGGPTETVSLLSNSPAINAGNDTDAPTTDQRGYSRNGVSDIGAYEYAGILGHAPTWTTTSLNSAAVSAGYNTLVTASDLDSGDHLTISLVSGPAWLQLTDNGNGTALLTGTPALTDFGTSNVELGVNDGTNTTDATLALSVTAPIAATSGSNVLVVNGTDVADNIHIWLRGANTLRVQRGGTIRNFNLAGVSQIVVNGFDGNDSIETDVGSIPVNISGGAGDDTIIGGDGADSISGDDGNDVIYGMGGDDRIYGGAGNDVIDTGSGRNHAWGGDGDDTLIGGNSTDHLSGDDGDDMLTSRGGDDFLDGGNGNDTAVQDAGDIRSNIEVLI